MIDSSLTIATVAHADELSSTNTSSQGMNNKVVHVEF